MGSTFLNASDTKNKTNIEVISNIQVEESNGLIYPLAFVFRIGVTSVPNVNLTAASPELSRMKRFDCLVGSKYNLILMLIIGKSPATVAEENLRCSACTATSSVMFKYDFTVNRVQ